MSTAPLTALVYNIRYEAARIISVELRPASPEVSFPVFEAGAHIDLHLGNGLVRNYSLINPSTDRQRYVVAVLNDRNSRGGSRYVHEQLRVGMTLTISAPRNNFKLHETAGYSVLVAGGIGVTPIYGMLQRLVALDRRVDVIYCARSRLEAAFIKEISGLSGPKVTLKWHFSDEQGTSPRLDQLLSGYPLGTHFYCCGPRPMLNAFEQACSGQGYEHAHVERFAAAPVESPLPGASCVVKLMRSGQSVPVPSGRSILDSLLDAGLSLDHSCREGICGSCETRIVNGDVEHLDSILTKAEKAANKSMMICVSRCKGGTLELDL